MTDGINWSLLYLFAFDFFLHFLTFYSL